MKLKNLLYFPLLAGVMTACSDVAEDDRYIETDEFTPARAVLLEDFTGQNCVNCPDAHEVIELLEEQYNTDGNVWFIPVSIHAGGFAIPANRGGLGTQEGQEYNDHYGIDKWPAGVIDGNSGVINYDLWAGQVRTDMSLPATMGLEITAVKNADNTGAKVTVTIDPYVSASKADLMVWVLENGIVARQKRGEETVRDYVHNNVFRAAVNPVWGDKMELFADAKVTKEYDLTFDEKWNPDNLMIVAFVSANGSVAVVNRADVK